MPDDVRRIDDFWSYVTEGADPRLPVVRKPELPPRPTAAQHQAWASLLVLARDEEFREAVRTFFRQLSVWAPSDRTSGLAAILREARTAYERGEVPDSPYARALGARYVALGNHLEASSFSPVAPRSSVPLSPRFVELLDRYAAIVRALGDDNRTATRAAMAWLHTAAGLPGQAGR